MRLKALFLLLLITCSENSISQNAVSQSAVSQNNTAHDSTAHDSTAQDSNTQDSNTQGSDSQNTAAQKDAERTEKLSVKVGYHVSVPAALDRNDQAWTGFYGQIYQCVLSDIEDDVNYRSFPVRRMAKLLESGKIDIGVLLARTTERDKHSTFVGPLIEHPYILLTKADKNISPNEDWAKWTLGTSYGTNFQYMLERYTTAKVETSSSWDAITLMLQKDRIDGVVIAREIVEKNISPRLLKGLKRTELFNLPSMKIGLYISNKSPYKVKLSEQFKARLKSCKKYLKISTQ